MDKLLPIGSVLTLKGGNTELIIVGYFPMEKETKKVFDYIAAVYPIGYRNENMILFNREDIDDLLFIGYQTRDSINFRKLLEENKDEALAEILKNNPNLEEGVK